MFGPIFNVCSIFMAVVVTVIRAEVTDDDSECLEVDDHNLCVRCVGMIMYPSRACTTVCESQDIRLTLTDTRYKGRICYEKENSTTGENLSIVIGVSVGAVICTFLIIGIVAYILLKRNNSRKQMLEQRNNLQATSITENGSTDREEFMKLLIQLKPEAPVLLDMLNKTRKKYQSLNRDTETIKLKSMKNSMRDLGRVLILLNMKENRMKFPPDGLKLLQWTIKVLNRYTKNRRNCRYRSDVAKSNVTVDDNHLALNENARLWYGECDADPDEVKIQVENRNGFLSTFRSNNNNTKDITANEMIGTYVIQCEDGTAIMTTEL